MQKVRVEKMNYRTATTLSKILAGSILVSTLLSWKLALLPWSLIVHPWTELSLLTVGLNFPGFALCLVGSGGILLGKRWGYYVIYASLPFAIIGSCIPFVHFALRCMRAASLTPHRMMAMLLGMNLLVTGRLIWTHVVVSRKEA